MKRKILGFAAILIAVGASAFTIPAKKFTNPTWQYNGGTATSPSSYSELTGSPSCGTTGNLCQIVAPEDPSNPDVPQIDAGLATRISAKNTSGNDVFLHP